MFRALHSQGAIYLDLPVHRLLSNFFIETCESIEIYACKTLHKSPAPLTNVIVVVTEFLWLATSYLHLIYICAHSIHYTYVYIIDIENTFLSHSYFHIFRGIGL